jgi:hypothetical protein
MGTVIIGVEENIETKRGNKEDTFIPTSIDRNKIIHHMGETERKALNNIKTVDFYTLG